MKILNIKWKNFGPYGNKWSEIDFSNSNSAFNLLLGHNGAGKSVIMEVIQFALYGKVGTKKVKDLPNRLNEGKNLESIIHLTSNNHDVIIERGVNPSFLNVKIDGNSEIGDIAGKVNVQDYLEEEIFNMSFYVFNNTISLSVNDFKSFIKMSPRDKRSILDKIFSLSIINKMYELLKLDIKKNKETDIQLTNKIYMLKKQIERSQIELDILNEKIKENIEERKLTIAESIKEFKEQKELIINKISEYKNIEKNITDKISLLKNSLISKETLKAQLKEKIELYKNDKCPECGSDLHTDTHINLLSNYKETLNKTIKDIEKINEKLETLKSSKNEILNYNEKTKQKYHKITAQDDLLRSEWKNIQLNDKIDEQTNSINNLIETSNKELDDAKKEFKNIENISAFNDLIANILDDNGVKKLAIKTIIPSINAQIYQLTKELNLDFKLVFDETFEAKITHLGKEISSSTLSTGENKKLDFAVIIALIRLMKYKFPGLNLLFLDELFSSLDADSTVHILQILNKISKEFELHIFVINHAILDDTDFDNIYRVEKTNGFSLVSKENRL